MSALERWADRLQSVTINVLPFDFVIASGKSSSVESLVARQVPSEAKAALEKLASSFEVPPASIVAATYISLVARLTGDEDILVGSATPAGNHLVYRANITPKTTLADLLEVVSETDKFADENPVRHADLSDKLDSDLFRSAIYFDTPESGPGQVPLKDLALSVDLYENMFKVRYNSLLYKKSRVEILLHQLESLLVEIAADSTVALSKLSLITKDQESVLPDPTADLDWSNFRGAIQDIFAANAAKFPDRTCVVETTHPFDKSAKARVFTYRQIDEASNIVAHFLVDKGIEVDDVVMIYAYRGVDLVVAVMGVLKAGATFSVIDPAYPPARQNIYLSVAKPRGLVVLRKAGLLSPEVREYVAENLQLKASIEDLELQDDGSLDAQHDVLRPVEHKKSQQTGVVVGPDSHPTLSFTSGSEGVPKGVRGRHFSLAYYFPWMAKTFGLSENDNFTMLSGIAHDPIQRDIFTPLFLGAKLLVPTVDDIGTPGRLAEWMRENEASVTHLTPAMGQLLSSQATAEIPSLHHAFFVGDILTKRDCVKLQALAHNVCVINMYGTTETQRAVSYFSVPSISEDPTFLKTQKDTIPAGKGMLNVQMLIVNRNDRSQLCGVGEVGEIYVRAGGLSDGYLELPDMTAEKFLTSWFVDSSHWEDTARQTHADWLKHWDGPRDRMYRTGDLGRYLPDGNTECIGRADDQVKIRGFRIELGEINTHISRHPSIRENVTLVRRNKDEEPVLVSYIVPEAGPETFLTEDAELEKESDDLVKDFVRYTKLIKDLRAYLKTKLPTYAVPSVIVPLSKLPLNPNGKIDKPRLPFPDTAQLELVGHYLKPAATNEHWTETEQKVRDLWLEVLPQKPPQIEPEDSFFDLGGHSILATKMIFAARAQLGVPELPLGLIFDQPTIKGFAHAIDGVHLGESVLMQGQQEEAVMKKDENYGEDANALAAKLPQYVASTGILSDSGKITVFLTGATGFLGSFILRDLLERSQDIHVVAHVRAKDEASGLERIKSSGKAYGTWKDGFASNIKVVIGGLEQEHFGLNEASWNELCESVDVVIHNGALVHWVYPYSTLRGPNVIGTINVMELCSTGKPKYFSFVSSTSVLDTEYYMDLSDRLVGEGKRGIPESDDLEGSRKGLGSGYGQSKWAAEYIIRQAGKSNGLRGTIVRPGYVLGDSQTGVSNTDDFLLRMVKGCEQLGVYPDITNSVNMVPVDHVARVTVAAAFHPPTEHVSVVQVTSHPRIHFSQFLGSLASYGYNVKETEYVSWRVDLEAYVVEKEDNALFPLLHFVLDNLPQSSRAPELDDSNAVTVLKSDAKWTHQDVSKGAGVDEALLGTYFSFLVACKFLDAPTENRLPAPRVSEEVLANFSGAGGRAR